MDKDCIRAAKITIFVGYCRTDKSWLDRLLVHLKPLERDLNLEVWSDSQVKAGADWRDELRKALERARVAVLLISADYLASDYIAQNELPVLLEAANARDVTILPVIVKPCLFSEAHGLARFKPINDPETPLIDLPDGKQDAVFVEIAMRIKDAIGPVPHAEDAVDDPDGFIAVVTQEWVVNAVTQHICEYYLETQGVVLAARKSAVRRVNVVTRTALISLARKKSVDVFIPEVEEFCLGPNHLKFELTRKRVDRIIKGGGAL